MKKKYINMDKKGQFYIFGAILLSVLVFFNLVGRIVLQESDNNFQTLYENYIYESDMVIDNAVYNEGNVSEQIANFTENYIDYALSKNTQLGIAYALIFEDDIRIVNYLNAPIYYNRQYIVHESGQRVFQNSGDFSLLFDNRTYDYDVELGRSIKFKALIQKIG